MIKNRGNFKKYKSPLFLDEAYAVCYLRLSFYCGITAF